MSGTVTGPARLDGATYPDVPTARAAARSCQAAAAAALANGPFRSIGPSRDPSRRTRPCRPLRHRSDRSTAPRRAVGSPPKSYHPGGAVIAELGFAPSEGHIVRQVLGQRDLPHTGNLFDRVLVADMAPRESVLRPGARVRDRDRRQPAIGHCRSVSRRGSRRRGDEGCRRSGPVAGD